MGGNTPTRTYLAAHGRNPPPPLCCRTHLHKEAYLMNRKVSITPAPMPLKITAMKNETVRAVLSIAHTAGSIPPSPSSPSGGGSVSVSRRPFAPSSVSPFSTTVPTPGFLPSVRRVLSQLVVVVAAVEPIPVPVSPATAVITSGPDVSSFPAFSLRPVSSSWVEPSPSSPWGSSLLGIRARCG